MSDAFTEPTIPTRLQRPLAAVWVSLGLHAALIALVQVAPPVSTGLNGPVIEARLVPSHTAAPASNRPPVEPLAAVPDSPPETEAPLLTPSETAEALPVAQPVAPRAVETAPTVQQAPSQPASPSTAVTPAAPAAVFTSAVDLTYYSARDVEVHPRALVEVVPDYPADADRQRVSGKVRLQLRLEADGRVSDADVLSATPPGQFEESALKAFRNVRFAPAQKNGRPVRALVLIEVVYDWEGRQR
jgi:protein TonB